MTYSILLYSLICLKTILSTVIRVYNGIVVQVQFQFLPEATNLIVVLKCH